MVLLIETLIVDSIQRKSRLAPNGLQVKVLSRAKTFVMISSSALPHLLIDGAVQRIGCIALPLLGSSACSIDSLRKVLRATSGCVSSRHIPGLVESLSLRHW